MACFLGLAGNVKKKIYIYKDIQIILKRLTFRSMADFKNHKNLVLNKRLKNKKHNKSEFSLYGKHPL